MLASHLIITTSKTNPRSCHSLLTMPNEILIQNFLQEKHSSEQARDLAIKLQKLVNQMPYFNMYSSTYSSLNELPIHTLLAVPNPDTEQKNTWSKLQCSNPKLGMYTKSVLIFQQFHFHPTLLHDYKSID